MIGLPLFAIAACLPVGVASDHILARDFQSALPEWATVAPEIPLALAPSPGVTRIFRVPELRRLWARFELAGTPEHEVCVARPVSPLAQSALQAAMQVALPDAHIQILEFGRQPVPQGEIEFPASGLRNNGPAGALWIGSIRYGERHRFGIWARVKVSVSVRRLVVNTGIQPGVPITEDQVTIETREEFPRTALVANTAEQVVGKTSRRALAAGAEIRLADLERVRDVTQGEFIRVAVRNGGAVIEFEAQADASGFIGERIALHNPASQKRFVARIEGKGRAAIELAGPQAKP